MLSHSIVAKITVKVGFSALLIRIKGKTKMDDSSQLHHAVHNMKKNHLVYFDSFGLTPGPTTVHYTTTSYYIQVCGS